MPPLAPPPAAPAPVIAAAAQVSAAFASGRPVMLAAMKDKRRILLVAAPLADDPRLRAQRAELARWGRGAADRDLSVVELVGHMVSGVTDDAESLRARFHLLPGAFTVVLVGKDGHEAYRSTAPIAAETLQGTIDAMPMRRAGQR